MSDPDYRFVRYGMLPIFPAIYGALSEEQIERMVERVMDTGDRVLLAGDCTQGEYDAWVVQLDNYARELLAQIRKA